MFILRFRLIWLQIQRVFEILYILIAQGVRDWFSKTSWGQNIARKGKSDRFKLRSTEERIRLVIEELGPTYIKFGQILADRPDVVTEALRRELKKLQNKARPMDDSNALVLIEKEIGDPIQDIFLEFDKRHIASASIGQTYVGRLRTGEKVVIKIQRPNVEAKIKLDLYLMKFLAQRAVKEYPDLNYIDLIGLIDEFGDTIMRELNYLNEANNIMRFGEIFKTDPNVYIPKVFPEYSSRKILVMEYIDGIPPDEPVLLIENGNDLSEVAANGAHALLEMIFVHGYFHADPHPGNIFVMKNDVVAFIDFGMVGTLKPRHMSFLASFILGFSRGDAKMITEAILDLCGKKFYEYSEEMEFEIEDLIKRNSYLPYDKIDFALVIQDCVNAVLKYKLRIPSSIYLLLKALATIQRFAEKLNPKISFAETILPYATEMVKKKYSPKKMAGSLYSAIGDYVSLFKDLPGEVNEILNKVKDGKLLLDINLHDSKPIINIIKVLTRRLALALLISALIICSTILIISEKQVGFAKALFVITCIMSLFLVMRYVLKGSDR